jgi:hypothetical protein
MEQGAFAMQSAHVKQRANGLVDGAVDSTTLLVNVSTQYSRLTTQALTDSWSQASVEGLVTDNAASRYSASE